MPTKLDEMEMTLRETTVKIQYFRKVVIDAKNEEDTAKVGQCTNSCSPTLTENATKPPPPATVTICLYPSSPPKRSLVLLIAALVMGYVSF